MPGRTYSDDRSRPEAVHPTAGSPVDWLGDSSISFDYFVDWSKDPPCLQNELWVKILLDPEDTEPDKAEGNDLIGGIRQCFPDFEKIQAFMYAVQEKVALELHFILFDDRQDWNNDNAVVFDVAQKGNVWEARRLCLPELKRRIVTLTGERRTIGTKGLKLSTSELEYALSKTDSLWPGDVDGIILHRDTKQPMAVLEYRKHTMASAITSVKPYYDNGKDKRKYDRIAVLAEALGVPVIVLTFPTRESHTEIQLERIRVVRGKLEVIASLRCQLPNDATTVFALKKSVYELMQVFGKWTNPATEAEIAQATK